MPALLLLMPLLGSLTAGFGGFLLGGAGAVWVTLSCVGLSLVTALYLFTRVALQGEVMYLSLLPWIESGVLECQWGMLVDTLTAVMFVVVTFVSTLVHCYSSGYMSEDPHLPRFMCYLSLFTFFMLVLVSADNLVLLFVGWEGVGLCSYLLINFWFTRLQANKAAIKAMVVNRIGDISLALGLFTLFYSTGSLEYTTVLTLVPALVDTSIVFLGCEWDTLTVVGILLFVGAMGKSAQLGLHTWLPDAMEGPTPVSALIHAATMVTAGVFLLGRCSPLFEYAPTALTLVVVVGAMTAFYGATVGLFQNDLKRVVAYSTCSQLGYMVFACGLSGYAAGIFHLTTHAFFKALLFLSAGAVIHALADEQDMRKMGGLRRVLPFTYGMFVIGSLALVGFPFLSGFYSKDMILELAYATFSPAAHFAYWLGSMGAFLTSFYSTRLIYLTFLAETNAFKAVLGKAHESPFAMSFPLGLLAAGSVLVGFFGKEMFIGFGSDFWGNALYTHPYQSALVEAEFIPAWTKLLILALSLGGIFSSYFFYRDHDRVLFGMKTSPSGRRLYTFFNRKWFFDKVYNDFIIQWWLQFSNEVTFRLIDRGLIELQGPEGLARVIYLRSRDLSRVQSGYPYHYTFSMLLGLTILLSGLGLRTFGLLMETVDTRVLCCLAYVMTVSAFYATKKGSTV